MIFHPKNAIAMCVAAACLLGSVTANAQTQSNSSEFTRRMAALQQARQRTETVVAPPAHRVAAQTAPRISRASAPVRVSQLPTAGSSTRSGGGFAPSYLQNSQFVDGTIIDGGSPIVQGGIIDGGYSNGQIISHDSEKYGSTWRWCTYGVVACSGKEYIDLRRRACAGPVRCARPRPMHWYTSQAAKLQPACDVALGPQTAHEVF